MSIHKGVFRLMNHGIKLSIREAFRKKNQTVNRVQVVSRVYEMEG